MKIFASIVMLISGLWSGGAQAQEPPEPPEAQPQGAPRARDLELAREAGVGDEVAAALLGQGSDLQRLEGWDENGQPYPLRGLTVAVPEKRSGHALETLRSSLGAGYQVFRSEQALGNGPDRVAVLRADDPFDVLRMMGSNGANYDIENDEVVERLRELDKRFGLRITGAGFDWVEAEILREPADWGAFAREIYEFCPDVVEQGTETVDALEAEMRKRRILFLWWD